MGKPFLTIELDKPRQLRYGMNAMVIVEDLLNKKISQVNLLDLSFKELRVLAYAGLYHDDKTLNLDVVGDLIDQHSSTAEMSIKIGEALTLAYGKPKNE
jgi:hypothetical protein